MNLKNPYISIIIVLILSACIQKTKRVTESAQPIYQDIPYLQDYAIKYFIEEDGVGLIKVFADRNGVIRGTDFKRYLQTQ